MKKSMFGQKRPSTYLQIFVKEEGDLAHPFFFLITTCTCEISSLYPVPVLNLVICTNAINTAGEWVLCRRVVWRVFLRITAPLILGSNPTLADPSMRNIVSLLAKSRWYSPGIPVSSTIPDLAALIGWFKTLEILT